MKIVTATELFLEKNRRAREEQFKEFIQILKLENGDFTDGHWHISGDDDLIIDIDECYFTLDGHLLEVWLVNNATGDFSNDKWLTIEHFN